MRQPSVRDPRARVGNSRVPARCRNCWRANRQGQPAQGVRQASDRQLSLSGEFTRTPRTLGDSHGGAGGVGGQKRAQEQLQSQSITSDQGDTCRII